MHRYTEPWWQSSLRITAPVSAAVLLVGWENVWVYPPALIVVGGTLLGRPYEGLAAALVAEMAVTYRHGLAACLIYLAVVIAWGERRYRRLSVPVLLAAGLWSSLGWSAWLCAGTVFVAVIGERILEVDA